MNNKSILIIFIISIYICFSFNDTYENNLKQIKLQIPSSTPSPQPLNLQPTQSPTLTYQPNKKQENNCLDHLIYFIEKGRVLNSTINGCSTKDKCLANNGTIANIDICGGNETNCICCADKANGFTYIQRYYKNHPKEWEQFNGELCDLTCFKIFNTSPTENSWFILASQWCTANISISLNGASLSPKKVEDAFNDAYDLLKQEPYCLDNDIPKKKQSKYDRKESIKLSEILDKYNNGIIGPGNYEHKNYYKDKGCPYPYILSKYQFNEDNQSCVYANNCIIENKYYDSHDCRNGYYWPNKYNGPIYYETEYTELCGYYYIDLFNSDTDNNYGRNWNDLVYQYIINELQNYTLIIDYNNKDYMKTIRERTHILLTKCEKLKGTDDDDAYSLMKILYYFNNGNLGPTYCDIGDMNYLI